MKKTLLIALLALALTPAVFAGPWSFQQIGPIGHYYNSDGSNYTTQQFGNQTYWSGFDADGDFHSGSWTRFGNNTYGFGN